MRKAKLILVLVLVAAFLLTGDTLYMWQWNATSSKWVTMALDGDATKCITGASTEVACGGGAGVPHALLDGVQNSDTLAGSVTAGDLIFGNATPKWARLPAGNQYQVLTMGAVLPLWGQLNLGQAAAVTGTLAQSNGGTGQTTFTTNGVVYEGGSSALLSTAAGATNTLLHGNTGAAPTYSAVVEADQTLADNTTANVSTTAHGYAPKLPNDATKYLDGTGLYSVPSTGQPDQTDHLIFIPGIACFPNATATTVSHPRRAAGDWALAYTTDTNARNWDCPVISDQRTTANKGVKVTSYKVIYRIDTADMTTNSAQAYSRLAVNGGTPTVSTYGASCSLATTHNTGNDQITTCTIASPAWANADITDYSVELSTTLSGATAVYSLVGIWVYYTANG